MECPIMQSLTPLTGCPAAVCQEKYATDSVALCNLGDEQDQKAAQRALKDLTMTGRSGAQTSPADGSLHIDYDGEHNAVSASVILMPVPTADGLTTLPKMKIAPGKPLPYIRLPDGERPTLTTTVQLHSLSREQEFAFRTIMQTMEPYLTTANAEPPQLTMCITGSAGAISSGVPSGALWSTPVVHTC